MILFNLFDNVIKLPILEVLFLKVSCHKSGLNSWCCVTLQSLYSNKLDDQVWLSSHQTCQN